MNIQRLRNLTTQILHTEMGDIYKDLEWIMGESGLMTHMLPRVCDAVTPWLQKHVADPRFWEKKHDPSHIGEIDLPTPTKEERDSMFNTFAKMSNPLAGKEVIAINV